MARLNVRLNIDPSFRSWKTPCLFFFSPVPHSCTIPSCPFSLSPLGGNRSLLTIWRKCVFSAAADMITSGLTGRSSTYPSASGGRARRIGHVCAALASVVRTYKTTDEGGC